MKKTVFAVWGTEQQGKSDTVKKLAQKITTAFPEAIIDPNEINYSGDIQVTIKIEKIKIGIESQGDPNSRLIESLAKFASANCDIIVCSTRTKGMTVDAVSALYNSHGYDIVWVTNHRSYEKDQSMLNDISANCIFELIQQVITGAL